MKSSRKILILCTWLFLFSGMTGNNIYSSNGDNNRNGLNHFSLDSSVEPRSQSPSIKIVPEYIEGYSGNQVSLNVVLFNFDTDTTSLIAIEFYIDFDNSSVNYLGVSNFHPLLPANQWFYSNPSPTLNRFACNWAEPSLSNLIIPDSTVIMTLHFGLIKDFSPLTFDPGASLFVHLGPSFNLIELNVQFYNGFINVLTTGIPQPVNDHQISQWLFVEGNSLFVIGYEGWVKVYNLNAQLVISRFVTQQSNKIGNLNSGIYIVTLQTPDQKLLSKKILIN